MNANADQKETNYKAEVLVFELWDTEAELVLDRQRMTRSYAESRNVALRCEGDSRRWVPALRADE